MRYIEFETGPWPANELPWWYKMLQKIIPAANPDLEGYYALTRRCWVELDDVGKPRREIGFDSDGKAIVLGPIGKNYGFLVDSSVKWSDSIEGREIREKDFNETWEKLWLKFRHLAKGDSQPGAAPDRR